MRCPNCQTQLALILSPEDAHLPLGLEPALNTLAQLMSASVSSLRSSNKGLRLSAQRGIICAVLRNLGYSTVAIGHALNKDHSSVLAAARTANAYNTTRVEQLTATMKESRGNTATTPDNST